MDKSNINFNFLRCVSSRVAKPLQSSYLICWDVLLEKKYKIPKVLSIYQWIYLSGIFVLKCEQVEVGL